MRCRVEGCPNEANVPGSARDLCRAHYRRWQNWGDENAPLQKVYSWEGDVCAEPGCGKRPCAHGLCDTHYRATRRRHDPEGNRRRCLAFKERTRRRQEALMGRPRPERCELCGEPGYGRKPSIVFDHDHATGQPRGWLCDRCNKVLGLVHDDPALLAVLQHYLEDHRGKTHNEAA